MVAVAVNTRLLTSNENEKIMNQLIEIVWKAALWTLAQVCNQPASKVIGSKKLLKGFLLLGDLKAFIWCLY